MSNPIGQLKTKVTVYCSVCGQNHTRILKTEIFKNTEEELQKTKVELQKKANKVYTCRICKSITNQVN